MSAGARITRGPSGAAVLAVDIGGGRVRCTVSEYRRCGGCHELARVRRYGTRRADNGVSWSRKKLCEACGEPRSGRVVGEERE